MTEFLENPTFDTYLAVTAQAAAFRADADTPGNPFPKSSLEAAQTLEEQAAALARSPAVQDDALNCGVQDLLFLEKLAKLKPLATPETYAEEGGPYLERAAAVASVIISNELQGEPAETIMKAALAAGA